MIDLRSKSCVPRKNREIAFVCNQKKGKILPLQRNEKWNKIFLAHSQNIKKKKFQNDRIS